MIEDGRLTDAQKRDAEKVEEILEGLPGLEGFVTIVATARVDHHAPCVPECPVCYQYCEKCDMTHHTSGVHDDVREVTSVYTTARTDTGTFTLGGEQ